VKLDDLFERVGEGKLHAFMNPNDVFGSFFFVGTEVIAYD
jgi:hypothetical protein